MDDVIKSFLVSVGFAVDGSSQRKAEDAQTGFERHVTESDRRTTKARLREALARGASDADSFEKRVKFAKKLEQIDSKFGGLTLRRTLRQAAAHAQTNDERIKWLGRLAKAEEEHRQRTMSGLQRVAGVALTVAASIQAATVAFAGYATQVAAKLEAMAYASDRTGSSVASLKIFSQAVSQLGGSAGGALNDLESFAQRLRSNPQGYTAFLKSVGVEARDAKGNIRGAAELYKEFRAQVGKKPYEQQLLYMQEMGVSEQTWRATDPAKLAAEEAAQRAKYARMGYDPDKAKDDAKELQHALRDMFDTITIIGEKATSKIFKDVGGNLKEFTTFLEQHGDQIAEILSKVAQMVLALSKALLEMLASPQVKAGMDWLLGMFGHVEEGTGKWIADTERIKAALEALAVFVATVFVAKITGAFAEILKQLGPLLVRLAPLLALLGLAGFANSNGVLTGPGGSRSIGEGILRTLDPGLADRVYGQTEGDKAADAKDDRTLLQKILPKSMGGKDAPGAGSARIGKMAQGANAQAIIGEMRKAGYNDNAIAAVVGSMQTESSLNPAVPENSYNHGHHGLWQWDSTRWPKIKKWILDQKGDPNDAAWQTRAWIAEHNAKPGDAIYDGRRTERGGAILRNNPSLDDAIHGVRESERFGVNEEGGRADNARKWLPHLAKPAGAAPAAAAARAPGWIDKDTYTDGLNTFKRGADGNMSRATNIPGQPATSTSPTKPGAVEKLNEGMNRLDMDKFRGIGAATQGFDPKAFLNAPPIGSNTTSTDNSVRHQSYRGGDTHVAIHTHGDVRETAELWKRHGERQKADDLRYAASVFT